ncbi:Golgi-associated plant pathogenesis-related protein 1 [Orchesella cincta]|uniref:Golgi-associated plant pathogenesis-related protein 1 n=1 Tax=Orchesella cincta TaxID=48709 RepID=A0A1D2MTV7_ORCCI|nr:Golgi-associated plant pathogenesis-related protein 1 [Orchesella cincta]
MADLKKEIQQFLLSSFMWVVVSSLSTTDIGRNMVVRTHQGVCWYEYLKVLPNTNSRKFGNCYIQAPNVLKQIVSQNLDDKYFGDWMIDLAMVHTPKHYHNCNIYLKDPQKPPKTDHSDTLLESTDGSYPFRGFVHCLVDNLEKTHGKKALSDLKRKFGKEEHWKEVFLNRENEFRKRHGSEPLKLAKQLSTQAQKWADKLAKECNPHHSKNDDPDRQFQGDGTGESLAMASAISVPVEDAALVAANGWYEEIKDYPFPDGYNGNGGDSLFPKIGHFTQSVWKGTLYVGYGYASNKDCSSFKTYVVARYFPAGNMIGDFAENVKPPKD